MDVITKDVRALAKKELAAANRRFRMFASPHEGYAVIREELDELIDEVRKLHFGLTIRLWRDVKRNEPMKREHLNLIMMWQSTQRWKLFSWPQWSRNTNAASGTTGRAAGCRTMERGLNL